jgi:hypothetical protein
LLLRELGRFKRAVSNLISRKKMDEKVKIISPLEAKEVKEDLNSIEQVMLDPVHLLPPCYGMMAEEIMRVLESWKDNKEGDDSGWKHQQEGQTAHIWGWRGKGGEEVQPLLTGQYNLF